MKPAMTFDDVVNLAREEHQRYLNDLMATNGHDDPLPHIFLFDKDHTCQVLALMIDKHPNQKEFLDNLRLSIQTKILLEGPYASIFCGIVLSTKTPPDLEKLTREKEKTDPNFLETMAKEHGVVLHSQVMVTAESSTNTFVRHQKYYVRDNKVHLDGEAKEAFDKGVPRLPHCHFKWPRPR